MAFHNGIDVALPQGTPLTAGADGVVVKKGSGGSGGNTLILKHAGGMHTVYYHLQRPSHLAVGAPVKTGDVVAHSGNTGASTGPHLHFELRRSARWGDTIDPAPHIVKAQTIPEPVAPVVTAPTPAKPYTPPWIGFGGAPPSSPIGPKRLQQLKSKFGNFGRRGWFGG